MALTVIYSKLVQGINSVITNLNRIVEVMFYSLALPLYAGIGPIYQQPDNYKINKLANDPALKGI